MVQNAHADNSEQAHSKNDALFVFLKNPELIQVMKTHLVCIVLLQTSGIFLFADSRVSTVQRDLFSYDFSKCPTFHLQFLTGSNGARRKQIPEQHGGKVRFKQKPPPKTAKGVVGLTSALGQSSFITFSILLTTSILILSSSDLGDMYL